MNNCQSREGGKNFARYVPRDQLPVYQVALASQKFQQLTEQYAQQVIVNNLERMRHGTFSRKGFFIGSGVVEAGCKRSGIFRSRPGTGNVLALRCVGSSRRLDQFWKERLNAHAARNDSMALAA